VNSSKVPSHTSPARPTLLELLLNARLGFVLLVLGFLIANPERQEPRSWDQPMVCGHFVRTNGAITAVLRGTEDFYQAAPFGSDNTIADVTIMVVRTGSGLFQRWRSVDEILFDVDFVPGKYPPGWSMSQSQNLFADALTAHPPSRGPLASLGRECAARLRSGQLIERSIHPVAIIQDLFGLMVLMFGAAGVLAGLCRSVAEMMHRRRLRGRTRALRAGKCPTCGYPVYGFEKCPECGESMSLDPSDSLRG